MFNLRRILTISATIVLSACGNFSVSETLGIGSTTPDEFKVISRPPLSVPPEFDLRPPAENEEFRQTDPSSVTRNAVGSGENSGTGSSATGIEAEILKKVRTDRPSSNIREVLEQEAAEEPKQEKKSIVDKIVGFGSSDDKKDAKDKKAPRLVTAPASNEPKEVINKPSVAESNPQEGSESKVNAEVIGKSDKKPDAPAPATANTVNPKVTPPSAPATAVPAPKQAPVMATPPPSPAAPSITNQNQGGFRSVLEDDESSIPSLRLE